MAPVIVSQGRSQRMSWRGLGAADLAMAVLTGTEPRASGGLAYNAMDILQAVEEASSSNTYRMIESRCDRPEPVFRTGI